MRRAFQITTGILLGVAVSALFLLSRAGRPAGEDAPGHFLSRPLPGPDFVLTGTEGERRSLRQIQAGRPAVLFFGFTHCPDVCPVTVANLARALERIDSGPERMAVVFVTVDPRRDTPERLRSWLAGFHGSFTGLRGTEEEVRAAARKYGVFFQRTEADSGYGMSHTGRAFVVTPEGRVPLTFPAGTPPGEMARDLERLLNDR